MKSRKYLSEITSAYQKREDVRAYTNLLLTLAAIVVFGVFAIRPTLVTIINLNKQLSQKRDTIAQLDTKIQNLNTAQLLWRQQQEKIALIDQAVPTSDDFEKQIRQIEAVAQKNQVTISGIKSGNIAILGATSSQGERSVAYTVDVAGDFRSVLSFASDLEKLRRPFVINTLVLAPGTGEQSGSLIINITGESPYYEE